MVKPTIPDSIRIKQYHGVFTQTGTADPVVTVLHNTLGGTITWTRSALGIYLGTSAGLFTLNKTVIIGFGGIDANGRMVIKPETLAGTVSGTIQIRPTNINEITLNCYTALNGLAAKEYSDQGGSCLILINVYE